ncbi:hypothetical protein J6590_068744 [Homalodisca vitripennis]|nr:hypothetical protein J6590_068744 [Homalodisca vitripennis]
MREYRPQLTLTWIGFNGAASPPLKFIFGFYIVQYVPAKYGPYVYPDWAELIGISLSLSSMLWIPGYALYYLITTPGSFKEVNL